MQNLQANINYKTQIFSTSKFEINYFKNIPDDHKKVKVNHHQGIELQIRTDHMNEEERDKITPLCQKYKDCFYNQNKKLSATSAVTHNIRTKDDHPIFVNVVEVCNVATPTKIQTSKKLRFPLGIDSTAL